MVMILEPHRFCTVESMKLICGIKIALSMCSLLIYNKMSLVQLLPKLLAAKVRDLKTTNKQTKKNIMHQ